MGEEKYLIVLASLLPHWKKQIWTSNRPHKDLHKFTTCSVRHARRVLGIISSCLFGVSYGWKQYMRWKATRKLHSKWSVALRNKNDNSVQKYYFVHVLVISENYKFLEIKMYGEPEKHIAHIFTEKLLLKLSNLLETFHTC